MLLELAISRPKLTALVALLSSAGALKARRSGADESGSAEGKHDGDRDDGADDRD